MEILELGWIIKNIGVIGKGSDELKYNMLFIRRSFDDK